MNGRMDVLVQVCIVGVYGCMGGWECECLGILWVGMGVWVYGPSVWGCGLMSV